MSKRAVILALVAALASPQAAAWGDAGHKVTALIAYRHLSAKARSSLDAMLASDSDPLTLPDFASRATWADKYRVAHRETAAWHFVDVEIDSPDLQGACFGFPPSPPGQSSQGPAQDCVVNKIEEFMLELQNSAASAAERLLALKFLIHFIGDLHQPLHAADHQDRGGNCVGLNPPQDRQTNLHAYWDVAVVDAQGSSPEQIADELDSGLIAGEIAVLSQGTPRTWAMETFEVGRRNAYAIASKPTCDHGGSIALPAVYQAQAEKAAATQLLKAGVRMAAVLNRALDP
ncbi:MAG TPA: S1/P1 nuclease [Steroidobacteraceae bacterium]